MRNYLLSLIAITVIGIVSMSSQIVQADTLNPALDQEGKNTPGTRLNGLSESLFGERIDPHLGGVSFSVVDASIPGNFDIPVEVRRTINQGQYYHPTETGAFGDWDLDVPRITFNYLGDAPSTNRCSNKLKDVFSARSAAIYRSGSFSIMELQPDQYGAGFQLNMNGSKQELADRRYAQGDDGAFFPSNATHVTKDNWYFTCTLANDGSEGFIGHSPGGKIYTFNHVVSKRKTAPMPDSILRSNPEPTIDPDPHTIMTGVALMVTKIEDQFGNFVDYKYSSNREDHLESIEASDGRVIQIAYRSNSSSGPDFQDNEGQISEINIGGTKYGDHFSGGRTWKYDYRISDYHFRNWEIDFNADEMPRPTLATVTQPDNQKWIYELDDIVAIGAPSDKNDFHCDLRRDDIFNLNVTHPYGAKLSLKLQQKHHRLSDRKDHVIYNQCNTPLSFGGVYGLDTEDVAYGSKISVTEKIMDINGQNSIWAYTYEQDKSKSSEAHRDQVNTTVITGPDERVEYEHFWLRLGGANTEAEGQVAQIKTFDRSGNRLFETRIFEYEREAEVGFSFADRGTQNRFPQTTPVNLKKLEVKRHENGGIDTYTTTYTYNTNHGLSNYSFGLPTKVDVRSSISSASRITDTLYEHNTNKWIIGLPKEIKLNNRVEAGYVYNENGQKITETRYNEPYATYTYHSGYGYNGTLASIKNAAGDETKFRDYKRGVPKLSFNKARLPVGSEDFSVVSAYYYGTIRYVDDNGWLVAIKDPSGKATNYKYDSMGRVYRIIYPKVPTQDKPSQPSPPNYCKTGVYCEPPVATETYWNDTFINYDFSGSEVVQTITKGNEQQIITYDSLLRPKLEQTLDNSTNWSSYIRTTYDTSGRVNFKSFPSSNINPVSGTSFTYDSMGRELSRTENVTPSAETKKEYLNLNRTRFTDEVGQQTTQYQNGFGELIRIIQPMGVNTYLNRNQWGELESLRQTGSHNGHSVDQTHRYVYDDRRLLCRYHTPSGRSTLYAYDAAWRMSTYSKGHEDGNSCAAPSGDTKVVLTYDEASRLTATNFADANTPDISYTYDQSDNLIKLVRGGTQWTYAYDTLNNLTGEQLTIDSQTFTMNYEFNPNGHLDNRTLPGGNIVEFAPDGLGRPTQAMRGTYPYATSIDYHYDGSVKDMLYGNDHVFSRELTPRLQTKRLYAAKGSTKAIDFNYIYDARGLVKDIDSAAIGGDDRVYDYDNLGRLTSSTGPWGSSSYVYDPLGNIRKKMVGSRVLNMTYAGNNRLSSHTDTAGPNRSLAYDTRGNITELGDLNFTYDMADQPRSMTGSAIGSYVYDGNMRRVKAVVNGETIYNVYDKSGGLVHIDIMGVTETKSTYYISVAGMNIARVSSTEATTSNQPANPTGILEGGFFGGGLIDDLGDNSGAVGIPVTTFLHPDHLGSAQTGTDQNGSIVWREQFMPYGQTMNSHSANEDLAGFTGHIKDSATGLNYMQQRYYDPLIGQFLSQDPVTFLDTGTPSYFNRYRYCSSDPINCFDTTGMSDDSLAKMITDAVDLAVTQPILGATQAATNDAYTISYLPNATSNLVLGTDLATPSAPNLFSSPENSMDASMRRVGTLAYAVGAMMATEGQSGSARALVSSTKTTTVGRWMSKAEASAMTRTGLVQESRSGLTHVANPASASTFARQAPSGSVYAQFDVPSSSLRPSGTGVSSIPGPNAPVKPAPSMPAAKNIRILDEKT